MDRALFHCAKHACIYSPFTGFFDKLWRYYYRHHHYYHYLLLFELRQNLQTAPTNPNHPFMHPQPTKTNSKRFAYAEITVRRRYSDFLWLYNQLTEAHPGIIVPPVPEKHAIGKQHCFPFCAAQSTFLACIGRFEGDFIEGRRLALERCLKRVLAHKTLRWDADLRVFLESDSFTNHVHY